jgi:hypothetical protein
MLLECLSAAENICRRVLRTVNAGEIHCLVLMAMLDEGETGTRSVVLDGGKETLEVSIRWRY